MSAKPQNPYDDPDFFAGYSQLERFGDGWTKAFEHPSFMALLPDVSGRRVLDLVVSSLALHYVADYRGLIQRVARGLIPGGVLVYSTEHPVYLTRASTEGWIRDAAGQPVHWAVDAYAEEGLREERWFTDGVQGGAPSACSFEPARQGVGQDLPRPDCRTVAATICCELFRWHRVR